MGGKNRLPMADLRALLEGLGCADVRTLIQSGNAVYELAPRRAAGLSAALTSAIEEHHGLSVPVVTRSAEEFLAAAARHPFAGAEVDEKRLHVLFLRDAPTKARARALDPDRSPPDRFLLRGRELYLDLPNGAARSKLQVPYFDRTLGTIATGRNWRTVQRIAALVRG